MIVMFNPDLTILLLEDDAGHAELIRRAFAERTTAVRLIPVRTLAAAREQLAHSPPDLAILDLRLPDGRGLDLLPEVLLRGVPSLVMTGHGDEAAAVEAMKGGALDYIIKSEETLARMPHLAARALREWHHMTKRRQAEELLRESHQELEAFVRTASHDLRSPLTPILAYAEFLRDNYRPHLDAQALGCINEIESQGLRLLTMLDDLLALARAGHLEPADEPVEVRQLVLEVANQHPLPVPQATVLPPTEPFTVRHLPQTPLLQIFSNLIGNARRYAAGAGSPIEIGAERQGERVRFFVRDHGPGIPENERVRIFETFYRGATTRNIPGSGVGLATVRKIARTYGGGAWMEETEGGGSTFWVEMLDTAQPTADDVDTPLRLMQLVLGDYCEWPLPPVKVKAGTAALSG
jgi:signal transduction histidine kinase